MDLKFPKEYLINEMKITINKQSDNIYEIICYEPMKVKGIFKLDPDAIHRLVYGFESMHGLTIFYGIETDYIWIKPHHLCIPVQDMYELKEPYIDKNKQYIYVLALEGNKFYVGRSKDPSIRIGDHMDGVGKGARWTEIYKPIHIIEVCEMHDDFDEDHKTLKLMREHGIESVRGGSFCSVNLRKEDNAIINKMIQGSENKCYQCNESGHYADKCPNKKDKKIICQRCGRESHTATECFATKHKYGYDLLKCERCGRENHTHNNCYATKHLDGHKI
jgi:predicted GIY-YIG superfamily endonuclease